MKQALSFKALEGKTARDMFAALISGEIEHIACEFVDREICEKVENGWLQLIPYVSLASFAPDKGTLTMVQYRRPAPAESTEGEERLRGKASVGFGGHIDRADDIVCETLVDGKYLMTSSDIIATCVKTARRELTEELGFDPIETFNVDPSHIVCTLIHEEEPDDVGKVHTGISLKVIIRDENFREILNKAKAAASEVEELQLLAIDIQRLLLSFNVSDVSRALIEQLTKEANTENWTNQVIVQHLADIVEFFQKTLTYEDLLNASRNRYAAIEVSEAKQAEQELPNLDEVVAAQVAQAEQVLNESVQHQPV